MFQNIQNTNSFESKNLLDILQISKSQKEKKIMKLMDYRYRSWENDVSAAKTTLISENTFIDGARVK